MALNIFEMLTFATVLWLVARSFSPLPDGVIWALCYFAVILPGIVGPIWKNVSEPKSVVEDDSNQ